MVEYECSISEIQQLRAPKVYRLKASCGSGLLIEVELHEEVVEQPRVDDTVVEVYVGGDREACLEKYFCAQGYIVSNTMLGGTYRTVISLHGLLVVIRSPGELGLKPMDKVYVGLTFKSKPG
ncbi:MAG: DNA-directed RNA polymerase subunit G [Desulfurococcus sp.]|nr:DNA-directed RNA polymerase subunit G [Desulfurococcus sp.]